MGAVSFQDVVPMPYDCVYYHDYHGWRDTKTDCSEAFASFVAQDDQTLEAVSFYTAADSVTYVARIYDRFEGGQLLDELTSQTGFIECTGFHTIDLDSPVELNPGDSFYIYVSVSSGGQPYDRTSDIPVLLGANYRTMVTSSAHPGESYYFNGASWMDLYDLDTTASFCIKGLAVNSVAMSMQLPDGIPDVIPPMTEFPITVSIADGLETYVPGSGALHYRFDDGEFSTAPLVSLGDDLYQGTLPQARCDDVPQFYFSAEGDGGTTIYLPDGAPETVYETAVGNVTTVMADDFETDQGWEVSGDAVAGGWERGVPAGGGERGDPPTDYDGSGQCYLTGNEYGDSDVDGGYTYLTSPEFDLAETDATIHFALWYTNDFGNAPNSDYFRVYVSNNNGADWILAETIGPNSLNGWNEFSIKISDFVAPTYQLRVRFEASDTGDGSVVEAAIDDFSITTFECISFVDGDADGDGDVNVADAVFLINYIFKDGPAPDPLEAGDANCDGEVNIGDAVFLIDYIFKGGPEPGCK
jgi:hypothetical protein